MRNANGYGTVVCLDKTGKKRRNPWAVRVTVGWTEDGKQITKYIGYYPNSTEAKLALAKFHLNNLSLDANTVTFAELYEAWDEANADQLTDRNRKAYAAAFRLIPTLHRMKLKDIKTSHLQLAMDAIDRKASSRAKTKTLMNQMYAYAMQNDLVLKNYAEFVNTNASQDVVGKALEKADIARLWEMRGQHLADELLILVYTGMRIGEALALKTEDIHLEEGYIALHGTKTKNADRIVPIHDEVRKIIESRMDQRYLFEASRNCAWKYNTFLYHFKRFEESVNWDYNIHDFRKTFTTYALESSIPIEAVRAIVGHSQEGVTAAVYFKPTVENLVREMHKLSFIF